MNFISALSAEASLAHTPLLLALLMCAFVLSRTSSVPQRLRSLSFFAAMHLVCVVTAGLVSLEIHHETKMPTLVFAAVSFVGAVSIVLFGFVLPRLRVFTPRIVQDVLAAILSIVIAVTVASRAGVNFSGLIATSAVFTAILGFWLPA